MSGILMTMGSKTAGVTAFVPEGKLTMVVIAVMIAIGLTMGLVYASQAMKEWSR